MRLDFVTFFLSLLFLKKATLDKVESGCRVSCNSINGNDEVLILWW